MCRSAPAVTAQFERELQAYQRVGLQCEHRQSGLPFALGHAFRVPDQAQLDPAAFCRQLAAHLAGRVRIHDWTRISSIEASAGVATADGARIQARQFVLATHSPAGFNLVQAEMECTQRDGTYRLTHLRPAFTGSPTGSAHCAGCTALMAATGLCWLAKHTAPGKRQRWIRPDICRRRAPQLQRAGRAAVLVAQPRPADQLPYIGSAHDNVWVATGYGPDGLTWQAWPRAITEGIIGTASEIEQLLSPMRFTRCARPLVGPAPTPRWRGTWWEIGLPRRPSLAQ